MWSWDDVLYLFLECYERLYTNRGFSQRRRQNRLLGPFIQHSTLYISDKTAREFIRPKLLSPLIKLTPQPIDFLYAEWRDISTSCHWKWRGHGALLSYLWHVNLQMGLQPSNYMAIGNLRDMETTVQRSNILKILHAVRYCTRDTVGGDIPDRMSYHEVSYNFIVWEPIIMWVRDSIVLHLHEKFCGDEKP